MMAQIYINVSHYVKKSNNILLWTLISSCKKIEKFAFKNLWEPSAYEHPTLMILPQRLSNHVEIR